MMRTEVRLSLILLVTITGAKSDQSTTAVIARSTKAYLDRTAPLDGQTVSGKSYLWIGNGGSADVFFFGKPEPSPSSSRSFNPFNPRSAKAQPNPRPGCSGKASRGQSNVPGIYRFRGQAQATQVTITDEQLSWDGTCAEFNELLKDDRPRGLFSVVHASTHQNPDELTGILKDARDAEITGFADRAIAIYRKL